MAYYDFDPNKDHHLIGRVTLAVWQYRLVVERPVTRRFGKGGIDWVESFLEDFYEESGGEIILKDADGGTLLCVDDDGEGGDFLLNMVVGTQLVMPDEAQP